MTKWLIVPFLLLSACSTTERVRTVEVQVPVVQPCPIPDSVANRPDVPDTQTAIEAAPNLFERVKLLMAGRVIRDSWMGSAESAMQRCSRTP